MHAWYWNTRSYVKLIAVIADSLDRSPLASSLYVEVHIGCILPMCTPLLLAMSLLPALLYLVLFSLSHKKPSLEKSFLPLPCILLNPLTYQHTFLANLPHTLLLVTRWCLLAPGNGQEHPKFMKCFSSTTREPELSRGTWRHRQNLRIKWTAGLLHHHQDGPVYAVTFLWED